MAGYLGRRHGRAYCIRGRQGGEEERQGAYIFVCKILYKYEGIEEDQSGQI